jgi:hypothetical protein
MTASELIDVLSALPPDFPVKVIMNGVIDRNPTWNVCEDEVYIEGVSEVCENAWGKIHEIEMRHNAIIDEMIENDYQNELFEKYESETGKEPVPEEGGHTIEFEAWWVGKCGKAAENGCRDGKSALAWIKTH